MADMTKALKLELKLIFLNKSYKDSITHINLIIKCQTI